MNSIWFVKKWQLCNMIEFQKFRLTNGLTVLVNTDRSTPLAAMNILYNVGARDEDPSRTGFAHLFEHLMFGGSVNIPSYDEPLQMAGGENNAFTNNDFTNYYLTLPADNLETAFWLESDRMLDLAFSPKSLEVQRQVVVEEFRQRYLNQPYGDAWLILRPLAYKIHPYRWPTIGMEPSHIEDATLEDVRNFFRRFYHPSNAILALSGNVTADYAHELCQKWFEPIPVQELNRPVRPEEPPQTSKRFEKVERDVPADAIYKAWHCCARTDSDFHATDLLTDILSGGKSSRLYNSLVRDQKLFTNVSAYMLGDLDKSLVVAEGKLVKGTDPEVAEKALDAELAKLVAEGVTGTELTRVKNKAESAVVFGEVGIANRALNLCYYELLGDAALVNEQAGQYSKVTALDIKETASRIFREPNSSVLYYLSKQNS
jgi:zinc protease